MSDQKPCMSGCRCVCGDPEHQLAGCRPKAGSVIIHTPACPNAPKPAEPCPSIYEGWYCTLAGGHGGQHEAWSETMPIEKPFHMWQDPKPAPSEPKGIEPIDFEAAKRFAVFMHDAPAPTNPDEREIARAYLALTAKLKERDEEITQLLEACGDMELKRAIRGRREEAKRG